MPQTKFGSASGRRLRLSMTRACLLAIAAFSWPRLATAGEVVLEDKSLLAAFDTTSGALSRLEGKSTGWVIERRPDLAVSFRLHAPLPNRRDNFVLGQRQRATTVEKVSEHQVRIEWRDLVSEHGGVLKMTFTATVTLEEGALTFSGSLVNDSPLMVETIEYPYLGDVNPPTPDAPLSERHIFYSGLVSNALYPRFENHKGYWGVDYPLHTAPSPDSLFCLIQSADQGLYVEMHDPTSRYLLLYTFEQRPGVLESIGSRVPQGAAVAGTPVHLEFRTTHFVFAQPKSSVSLAPVLLRCYSGDWQAGADLYKQWRATWFKKPRIPAWAENVHSWQQLQVNSPEEEYRVPYRELPKIGDECVANGVGAIQLVGWNRGGQDRGNPSLDVDPGLGSWQELHDAIARIQAKGVKIVLFGKFIWADTSTAWYHKELYKYAIRDPYGDPYNYGGYSYHTPTQLAGINNRRFAMMCQLSLPWRDIATREFEKIPALGASGFLYDEVGSGGGALYCFDSEHGHPSPAYVIAGKVPLAAALHRAADKVNPDFLFAGESPEDMLLQYYPLSYFRIDDSHTAACRYIDSQAPMMVAVFGFDDREMLNRILMYRYIISYEPYYFKGRLGDFPLTLEYGKKIDALRRRYRETLWDGEYRDTLGATVKSDGTTRYSVFRAADGKRAVVVVNQEASKAITATIEISRPNGAGLVIATPERPDAVPTDGTLQIPARSAAVVMER
jgi:hypothetical protein